MKGKNYGNISINVFVFLLLVSLFCAMGAVRSENTIFRWASYVMEVILIGYTITRSKWSDLFRKYSIVLVCFCIIALNYLFSAYEPPYSNLVKFIGYFCCFKYGFSIAQKYERLSANRTLLLLYIIIPVVVVALFDDSVFKNVFFVNPNTFVYTGLSMGLLYLAINYEDRRAFWIAWAIVAFYVLICSSLGVVVAIILACLVLNIRYTHIPYLLVGCFLLFWAIMYVDIPIFIRFRDVISVWTSMSKSDWLDLENLNMYELGSQADRIGDRTDTTSSIWRLSHWLVILKSFVSKIVVWPFGYGGGYVRYEFGLPPHNDYLLILTEYGLFVFVCFVRLIIHVYKIMKNERKLVYIILAMFLYHITENLIDTFPPNAVLYFILGWCLCKKLKSRNYSYLNESTIN